MDMDRRGHGQVLTDGRSEGAISRGTNSCCQPRQQLDLDLVPILDLVLTDGRDGGDDLSELQFVQDRRFPSCVQTD